MKIRNCFAVTPLILMAACAMRPAELETLRTVETRLDQRRDEIGPYTLDMKASGSKMVLNGEIQTKGIVVPMSSEIYNPMLKRLKKEGIVSIEKTKKIKTSLSLP